MKQNVKTTILDAIFRLYFPICLRIEKLRALHEWRDGVRQCKEMYKEINSPRVYLFFDAKHMVWAPMTYEDNKKLKPAMRRLRIMGKVHGKNLPYDVDGMKEKSYYYTASKWGAKAVDDIPHLKAEKLKMWMDYYLCNLSVPMRKCRSYLQGYRLRHPERSANG